MPIDHIDLELVSQTEIVAFGAKPRQGQAPKERDNDLLERYLAIPNRMMLLYSSEDVALSQYIIDNWAALDGISGDFCDIYTSTLQMSGEEDAYTILQDLSSIIDPAYVKLDKLPIILLWSDLVSLCISLGDSTDEYITTKKVMRKLFQFLREIGRGIEIKDECFLKQAIFDALDKEHRSRGNLFVLGGYVSMTNNTADRGGVVVNQSTTGDIKTKSQHSQQGQNFELLAQELRKLRNAIKSDVSYDETERDIAAGHVATAEREAKSGNFDGALKALKAAGKCALEIGEKIGVEYIVKIVKSTYFPE